MKFCCHTGVILCVLISKCFGEQPPHIIFIVADDLGWNDVSWHNPTMVTPNLGGLAKNGVILNSAYVQYVCTPTRSCLMTGRYPFHTGMQNGIIRPLKPDFLPTDFKTLPEELKNLGYSTHIVGKWHLGYCNWKYTPTYRGFDSFYGFYGGSEGYYEHMRAKRYDFRFNKEVFHPPKTKYSAELFANRAIDIINSEDPKSKPLYLYIAFQSVHDPLQVPKQYENIYQNISSSTRKTYCGMVSALDDAVGNITDALRDRGYMNNTLIVFTTDNGGCLRKAASNYPLRGGKSTLWEGGTKGVAFAYSKNLLKKRGYENTEMIHAVDWFPTILSLAGGTPDPSLDGVNQWPTISAGFRSARNEFVYNIDEVTDRSAIRRPL
ncbi:arylsulfatase B-like isoform X2 [Mercenaria mercenaria]|uniref:arylsulfatase B-like isoform X2 n=1 Tax=Mercenaria mercenaria TaxID=6596 RepID=UPI00234E8819|nr:arylsulfatase B-like isoform X2 [Mercenaria mercenaria]